MSTSSALPMDPDCISPGWLTGALRERFPAAAVVSVEVLEVRHGTNSHARLRLEHAVDCGLPEVAFLKLPPQDPSRREAVNKTGMGRREALFYRTLADRVPMRVPCPYVARFEEASGSFVLLIEDLDTAGCTIPDTVAALSFEQAVLAMGDYAALHVRYEDDEIRAREAGWVDRMPRGSDFGTTLLQYGLDHHRDRLTDAFAELAGLYIEKQSALEEVWERGSVTVLQGDSHIGNLFEDHGRPGFLDWGLIHLGSPLRDVGYFICMALSPANRRKHERELLERYLEARRELGGEPIGFDEAWLLHRVHAAYNVPASCPTVTFPENAIPAQARTSAAFLERAECAIEDLEARAALREVAGI
ncbi:MAG: phosphotransferase [Myxococcota bacterium]|nr:phosphotransferase [Myxococcota bacterium]MDP6242957.1 phosphotransferase [Myxococcota bacterium]MDP7073987.1 phosphotransferase [Myxococcota bacterium]MDP7300249.1 phosphotransferase [Myxococcota bacterium]MDP7431450.1 phosphotransferase [Myxococcota bacterium]